MTAVRPIPRAVALPQTSLWFNLEVSATRFPDKTAIVFYGREISYGDLRGRCEALAGWLQTEGGVRKGDRVALCMQNCPQWIIAFYAILRADAVVVPINPMNREAELTHMLEDSGASAVVCAADVANDISTALGARRLPMVVTQYNDMLNEAQVSTPEHGTEVPAWLMVRADAPAGAILWADATAPAQALRLGTHAAGPDDMALLPYTSGTTGLPKGCVHLHRTVMHNVVAGSVWSGANLSSVALSSLPLYHVAGMLAGMHNPIFLGATVVLLPRWDRAQAAALITRHRVTSWSCISTMMIDFLESPELDSFDLSSLEHIGGGGAAMPASVAQRLQDRLGLTYAEGYGLTETMGATHRNPRERAKQQCLGVPFVGTRAAIVDPVTLRVLPQGESGEIVVSGPQVFSGYWGNPQTTREAFIEIDGARYFRTGDLGHVDEDGYYFLTDRLKRMINAAGFKVWPAEVEALLFQHPAVREACVIAKRDPYRGETVKAFVVLREGMAHAPSTDALLAWARERMATYKTPRSIEFIDQLPKSNAGKVLWRELQAREDALDALNGKTGASATH